MVDGKEFEGTERAVVCSGACRKYLQRLLKAQKKPDFYDAAKERGQRLPNLEKHKKPLTVEEKIKEREAIEKEIQFWKTRPCQGHPRMWSIKRDAAIEELQEKINKLK